MIKHPFIFHQGKWLGEGKVGFSTTPEKIPFYTTWDIEEIDSSTGIITCHQRVEMLGVEEDVKNRFEISNMTPHSFKLALFSELIDKCLGKGVIDEKTIAWEFQAESQIQGYEVYEIQDNGDYLFHAEYTATEQYRTMIDGRIWKKKETE